VVPAKLGDVASAVPTFPQFDKEHHDAEDHEKRRREEE
jgi:hypothetical protein